MTEPVSVTGTQVLRALEALGIDGDVRNVTHLEVTPRAVTVTRRRLDGNGRMVVGRRGDAATVIVVMPIDWSEVPS